MTDKPPLPLKYNEIPIERHWALSILFHNALGHTEPWEICDAGCDQLASDAINELFGVKHDESNRDNRVLGSD